MPWNGAEFKAKHWHGATSQQSDKAAKIATAMVERGAPEGTAIATGIARAKRLRARGLISDRAGEKLPR